MTITSKQARAALSTISRHIAGMEKEAIAADVLLLLAQFDLPKEEQNMEMVIEIAARYGISWS